jgi:two-component system, NtrC family, response regulator AtoC
MTLREHVLLIEDEPTSRALMAKWLELEGFDVDTFATAEECLDSMSENAPDAVCLDIELPGMGGIEALRALKTRYPRLPVLMLTATRNVEVVVSAMQAGAYDYFTKPVERTKLLTTVRNAIEKHRLSIRLGQLERQASGKGYSAILGKSTAMQSVFREVERVSTSDITVLIHGESGTGKELVARALHEQSARKNGAFVSLNCAAIPESLEESEFFGHEKGAFTGAQQQRKGRFELAHQGTLFLDEVAELSLSLQAKLLRVLQERSFQRVGGTVELRSDFRLVAATHRDLSKEVIAGRFRQDLYFRIAIFELELPALRVRRGDVRILAEHFAETQASGVPLTLAADALALIESYAWPGNVRELQNAIERASVVAEDGVLHAKDFPPRLREPQPQPAVERTPAPGPIEVRVNGIGGEKGLRIADIERRALEEALESSGGNVTEAVKLLGIGRTTVYRMMKRYGMR